MRMTLVRSSPLGCMRDQDLETEKILGVSCRAVQGVS